MNVCGIDLLQDRYAGAADVAGHPRAASAAGDAPNCGRTRRRHPTSARPHVPHPAISGAVSTHISARAGNRISCQHSVPNHAYHIAYITNAQRHTE